MKAKFFLPLLVVASLLVLFPVCAQAQSSVAITCNDAMKYDVTHIDAAPGQTIQVTLKDTGKSPKTSMAHNWVLLKKGVDVMAYVNAASKAKDEDYLPAAQAGQVLAHTRLLGPGESDMVIFTAPTEPGDYVFLCTFPAHYLVGMKGTLTVQ